MHALSKTTVWPLAHTRTGDPVVLLNVNTTVEGAGGGPAGHPGGTFVPARMGFQPTCFPGTPMSASQLAGSAAFCGVNVPFTSAMVGAVAGLSLKIATGTLLGSLSSPCTLNVAPQRR